MLSTSIRDCWPLLQSSFGDSYFVTLERQRINSKQRMSAAYSLPNFDLLSSISTSQEGVMDHPG